MCCSEFDNVKQLLDSKKCVTATASFEKNILDQEILNITRQQMIMKTKNKLKKKQLSALEVMNKHGDIFVMFSLLIELIRGLHWEKVYLN